MQPAQSKVKILFLCTGNSCRSQMAQGWARRLKAEAIEAHSAGIEPRGLDPLAVKAMAEAGIDISGQRAKHVEEVMHIAFDFVITVCGHASEHCPLFPGKTTVIHRGFDDPPKLAENEKTDEARLEHYRRVRDEIRDYVKTLPESLPEKDSMTFSL